MVRTLIAAATLIIVSAGNGHTSSSLILKATLRSESIQSPLKVVSRKNMGTNSQIASRPIAPALAVTSTAAAASFGVERSGRSGPRCGAA